MSEKATKNKALRLCLVGEIPDYYRAYYEDTSTGAVYTLTNFRSVRTWNTAASNGGEPDMPLEDGQRIEIVDGKRVISREVISRVNGCTSVGLPVPEWYRAAPGRVRRETGKEAAAALPDIPAEPTE